MGGRVGLKGTDGVANEAQAAGAEPIAGPRAQLFAQTFLELSKHDESLRVRWQTSAQAMGAAPLRGAGVGEETIEVVHTPGDRTTADDTRRGVDACIGRGAELLLFCGGDGTARDVAEATKDRIPILGIDKSLLGVDAVVDGKAVAKDLNEKGILHLLDHHPKAKLVVSPIGAQGFILGRGNLQVSPAVLRRIGTKNVIVVATPAKLAMTPILRVDTDDPALDDEFHKRE